MTTSYPQWTVTDERTGNTVTGDAMQIAAEMADWTICPQDKPRDTDIVRYVATAAARATELASLVTRFAPTITLTRRADLESHRMSTGSDKQIAWATSVRAKMIGADLDERLEGRTARRHPAMQAQIDRLIGQQDARWWIDNRTNTLETLARTALMDRRDALVAQGMTEADATAAVTVS